MRLPLEPDGPRPAVWGASGDVWQRHADGLWYRTRDFEGWSWFEVCIADGGDRWPITIPAPDGVPPDTGELPTIEFGPRVPA